MSDVRIFTYRPAGQPSREDLTRCMARKGITWRDYKLYAWDKVYRSRAWTILLEPRRLHPAAAITPPQPQIAPHIASGELPKPSA